MKLLIYASFIAVFLWLFPYFRILLKRISLYIRIKKACRYKGWLLLHCHAFPFFASNHAPGCDFCIETDIEIICVKLFATKHKNSILKFTPRNQMYYFTHSLPLFSRWGQTRMTYDSKLHTLPTYDFKTNVTHISNKKQTNILLIHPKCYEIHGCSDDGTKHILAVGDTVYGMRLESGKTFSEYLK